MLRIWAKGKSIALFPAIGQYENLIKHLAKAIKKKKLNEILFRPVLS